MDLITSHLNADFDALASMVAAKKLYPEAELVFPGSQEKKVRDFIGSFHPIAYKRIRDIDLTLVKRLVIVDTKSPDRIGRLASLLDNPGVKILLYDHHAHQDGDIHGTIEVLEEVGATTTIFSEILQKKKIKPAPMEATIMSLGIYEETGNFTFPTTTERDMKAAAWLLRCGASLQIISTYMKTELDRNEIDLLNELLHNSSYIAIGALRVLVAKASRDKYLGDAAHLAHRMIEMESADAVVMILRMENKVLIVGRSRTPEINVAEVLETFGGGGHPTAASATVREMPLEIIEERLSTAIRSLSRPGKFAEDIMTRPVITLEVSGTVKKAEEMMTRYGVNVLPVINENNQYMGVISREVVEKAIFHGFRKSRVTDFMTTDAETVERYTPVQDVESVMVEKNQRFVPVLEGGEIKGAITRTDILRSMYEDYLRRSRIKEPLAEERREVRKSLASLIHNRFPREICDLLRAAGEIAQSLNYKAYLVGGSVRDLLRGEENLDMDIVVEGDGIEFARELGRRMGARVRPHERFGTAKVISEKLKLDVATARTEYYEYPAALPKVLMSSIKKDLYRRDFTINTLAVTLNPAEFGKLVDFFGGQRDLKDRTIRVLHNLSFVEDPTRAFRAVRFAERFGFKISRHTENLIQSTLRMNLFERLSGSRLLEELSLIFREKEPAKTVKRLDHYSLLSVLHPALRLTEKLYGLLTSVHDALLWAGLSFIEETADRRVVYLTALVSELTDEEKRATLKRLAVPSRMSTSVMETSHKANELLRRLPLVDPALIYDELSAISFETLLYAIALTDDERKKKEISSYLLEFRKVKPLLRGEDLKEMGLEPGPLYSRIFREVLHEKLRGKLQSREEESRFVKGFLKETAKRP